MQRHPVQKPRVGIVADIDLDINKKAPAQKGSSMAQTSLAECRECTETGETKTLRRSVQISSDDRKW